MSKKTIYLDHAAGTSVDSRVVSLMQRITVQEGGNPSSHYESGKKAKRVLEKARKEIAAILGVKAGEIIFTSSGTESDNLAIFGVVEAHSLSGKHLITSNIEHLAVKRAHERLEKKGFKVTYLPVDKGGLVHVADVKKSLRPDTILVSIMQANNEIGTVQPIVAIGRIIAQWRRERSSVYPFFHVDACQTAGFLNIRPHHLGVDLLTFNGSKIYGPKGVGVLYKKNSIQLEPMLVGGSQENGWRAGTENVASAAGVALALAIAEKEKKKENQRLTLLRDEFIRKVLSEIPDIKLNGDAKKRLPHNINMSFKEVDGEMLVLALNQRGVEVSTGSACTTGETGPSHVLKAIKNPKRWGNIRVSLGRRTTQAELEKTVKIIKKEIARLRSNLFDYNSV